MQHTANHNGLTDTEIERRFDEGDAAGMGEAVGIPNDTPCEALRRDGYIDIRVFSTHGDLGFSSVGIKGDRIMAVCDNNGPWGVDITET